MTDEVDVEHWYYDAHPQSEEQPHSFSTVGMFFVGFFVAVLLGLCLYWFNGGGENVMEDSPLWGGYSEVNVRQIYDRKTKVLYAVTDTGNICVMVDADGKPRVAESV